MKDKVKSSPGPTLEPASFPEEYSTANSRTRLSAIGTATPEPPLNPAVLLPEL